MCRYCFEGEEAGELLSPCACKGGQRWVHLECLRRWQRMVLVSQPTHPMFHGDELRHASCNVCKSEFTCPPPTRHELMSSFTGPEIAALIDVGCVVAASDEFTAELTHQLGTMPRALREASSYEHWCASAYAIASVDEDDGLYALEMNTERELTKFRDAVDLDTLVLSVRGKRLKLTNKSGSFKDIVQTEDLREAFEKATAPCVCVFEEVDSRGNLVPRTCGDDHVVAVNLCRPITPPCLHNLLNRKGNKKTTTREQPEREKQTTRRTDDDQQPPGDNDDLDDDLDDDQEEAAASPEEAAASPESSSSSESSSPVTDAALRRRIAAAVEEAVAKVRETRGQAWAARAERVQLVHHVGGPCDVHRVSRCLVMGASPRKGYKFVESLSEAVFLAARLARTSASAAAPGKKKESNNAKRKAAPDEGSDSKRKSVGPGQRVRLCDLSTAPELNGRLGVVVKRQDDRFVVRVVEASSTTERTVAAKPANLRPDAPPQAFYHLGVAKDDGGNQKKEKDFGGRVFVYWGDARWSRTQLLGEIARGHWGLCKTSLAEILAPPKERRAELTGRLVFAPISAMTEETIARARSQMAPLRQQAILAQAAQAQDDDTPNDDDDQTNDNDNENSENSGGPN